MWGTFIPNLGTLGLQVQTDLLYQYRASVLTRDKNVGDTFSHFDRILACDRWTDILHYAYASHGKK